MNIGYQISDDRHWKWEVGLWKSEEGRKVADYGNRNLELRFAAWDGINRVEFGNH